MTQQYAVIGNPIGHTKSPLIHGEFAAATGQDMRYDAIEGPLGGFAGAVDAFRQRGGCGLNVTAPFKLDAYAYATEHSAGAQLAGAANALKFEADGRVLAENFDGVGLTRDIVSNLATPLAGQRVLLLGAGGAARGALLPFLAQAPASLCLVNRDEEKARTLASRVAGHGVIELCSYAALAGRQFDVVINATSASLQAAALPLPRGLFDGVALAYELAYGKGLTPFLAQAQAEGAGRLADGVGMLVEQAAEAFAWWRGVRPPTAALIERLRIPLV